MASDNMGESDKYLLKDHHEAIVSREVFDKAQEILAKLCSDAPSKVPFDSPYSEK